MFVVVAVAKFFYLLLFNGDSLGSIDNSSIGQYFTAIFNYPIYLFNSWGASNTNWLTFEAWLSNQGIVFDFKVLICYVLSFISVFHLGNWMEN